MKRIRPRRAVHDDASALQHIAAQSHARRRVRWIGALAGLIGSLVAFDASHRSASAEAIETEHLFGFTLGSDVGARGEREIESATATRIGKAAGSYGAVTQKLSLELVPAENVRTEFSAIGVSHDIISVPGFDDRRQLGFGGLSAELRYRLLDRAVTGLGLTLAAEPHWSRFEEGSGARTTQYGVDLAVAIDKELVADRVVGAFNLLYQPESAKSPVTGTWSSESMAGVASALMVQVRPGILIGGEARYLRRYDGIGFDAFAGHAVFVGPTVYAAISERAWFTLAYSAQVAGRDTGQPAALDLRGFERHQVRFLFGVTF